MAEIVGGCGGHTGCEWVLLILRVKCSYFGILIVENRAKIFNGSSRYWTAGHAARYAFMN